MMVDVPQSRIKVRKSEADSVSFRSTQIAPCKMVILYNLQRDVTG
jgi:hypothetical protein